MIHFRARVIFRFCFSVPRLLSKFWLQNALLETLSLVLNSIFFQSSVRAAKGMTSVYWLPTGWSISLFGDLFRVFLKIIRTQLDMQLQNRQRYHFRGQNFFKNIVSFFLRIKLRIGIICLERTWFFLLRSWMCIFLSDKSGICWS